MIIKDAVVIVTGASAGIGLAVARLLANKGARVVLAARSGARLAELEKEIPHSLVIPTDMREPADIAALISKTKEKFGRVDILINNAGQGLRAPIETIDLDEYKSVMELNVFSVLRAMQAVIPIMRNQGAGMIVNVGSLVSKNHFPLLAAYASTKYALNALSFTAREELSGSGIVVSVFHPKMTATDFGQNARGETYVSSAGRRGMSVDTPEAVAEGIIKLIEFEEAEAQM